jgi:hypothetical protein
MVFVRRENWTGPETAEVAAAWGEAVAASKTVTVIE